MPNINIIVRNKIAKEVEETQIVCGNSGYVAVFDFDEEWAGYDTKTARFIWNDTMEDVVFVGNECPIPIITNAFGVLVGVFAGDLHTTTAATIDAKKSILCKNSVPADPLPDVYNQIIELLKKHVYMRSEGGYIQYSTDGKAWLNVIAVSEILTEDDKREMIDAVIATFPVAEMEEF